MQKQKKVRQFLNGQQRGAGKKTPDLSLPESLRGRIWTTLQLFNFAFETPGSGLDGYFEVTDVLTSVKEELEQEHDMRGGNRIFDLEEVVKGTDTVEALWVIERFYSYIGDAHKLDFQGTINKEFKEQKSNWRLVDGQFSRVAPEIVAMPTTPQSDERSVEKLYEEACDRSHQAQKNLEAGDYMGAVHNACESFEAVLRCLLERDEANSLGDEPGNHWLHPELYERVGYSFGEQVLESFSSLRSGLAGNGRQLEPATVPKECAELSVHLLASFMFFAANLLFKKPSNVPTWSGETGRFTSGTSQTPDIENRRRIYTLDDALIHN